MSIQPANEVPKGRKHMVEFDVEEVLAALVRTYPNDMPRAQVIPARTSMSFDSETGKGTLRVFFETLVPTVK